MNTFVFNNFLKTAGWPFLLVALIFASGCSSSSGTVRKKSNLFRYEPRAAYKHKRLTPVYKVGRPTTDDSFLQNELDELKSTVAKQNAEIKVFKKNLFNRENKELRSDLKDSQENVKTLKQKSAGDEAKLAQEKEKSALYKEMNQKLSEEIKTNQVAILALQNRLTVDILDQVLFETGSAEINENGRIILHKISEFLKKAQDNDIRIEGHTDSDPIWSKKLKKKYDSNWELSAARAANVLRFLVEKEGIEPKRIYAAGYGDSRPVASNATPEGKARNRRIDIVFVSQ